jgi:hypothetical protein
MFNFPAAHSLLVPVTSDTQITGYTSLKLATSAAVSLLSGAPRALFMSSRLSQYMVVQTIYGGVEPCEKDLRSVCCQPLCNFRMREALGWTYIEGLVLRESLNIPGFHPMRTPVLIYHRHVCCKIIVHVELRGTALLGGGWVGHNAGDFRHTEGNLKFCYWWKCCDFCFRFTRGKSSISLP